MIVQICFMTSLTKADLLAMCHQESLQFYYAHNNFLVRCEGTALPAEPVYISDISQFQKMRVRLQSNERRLLVLIATQYFEVKTADGKDIPVKHVDLSTAKDLIKLAKSCAKNEPIVGEVRMSLSEKSVDIAQVSMGNSVMHKVQTNLYRIPKPLRADVQKAVFSYLSGNPPQLGKAAQYPYILTMLAADEMQNLRRACKSISATGIEAAVKTYKVDAFDMNFLLAQGKKDLPKPPAKVKEPKRK